LKAGEFEKVNSAFSTPTPFPRAVTGWERSADWLTTQGVASETLSAHHAIRNLFHNISRM
jgi:hypothetical protein